MELVGFHAKDPDTCEWVIKMFGKQDTEIAKQWVQACKEQLAKLESLYAGDETGSTGV